MSSRFGRCPNCGLVGAHTVLPDSTVDALVRAVAHPRLSLRVWTARGAWCPDCKTPYVTLWPEGMPSEERQALLASSDEPMEIDEKGGG
jgi:hypothetical protein